MSKKHKGNRLIQESEGQRLERSQGNIFNTHFQWCLENVHMYTILIIFISHSTHNYSSSTSIILTSWPLFFNLLSSFVLLIYSWVWGSVHWNGVDLLRSTHFKKANSPSITTAPHLGVRGSWAPPYFLLECCWLAQYCMHLVQASPAVFSCLTWGTKPCIQPFFSKEWVYQLNSSIFIALTERLAPKSSNSGKGWVVISSVL